MSAAGNPDRRDISSIVSDLRVDVAQIKTRSELQTGALARIEQKLDLGIFRDEYERRHKELEVKVEAAEKKADDLESDYERRQGAQRVWRFVYGGAIAALGIVEAVLHH